VEDSAEILIGGYLVAALLIDVLFARHLVVCLRECSPAVRTVKPWELWLLACPVVSVFWTFVILPRLHDTLQLEFRNRGLPGPDPALRRYANGFSTLQALSAVPCLTVLCGPFAFLNFIWYVQGIAAVIRTLRTAPLKSSTIEVPGGDANLANFGWDAPEPDAVALPHTRDDLRRAAKRVGLAMTITAVVCVAANVGAVVGYAVVNRPEPPSDEERHLGRTDRDTSLGPVCCLAMFGVVVYLPVIWSGLKLWNGRNSESAPLASMLLLVPASPGCIIGWPVGIWATIVLHRNGMAEVLRTSVYRPRRT
jgi:hypothetical protein